MVDFRLIEYIKTEEAQGYTADRLRTALIKQGYAARLVDEAIEYAAKKELHPALRQEGEEQAHLEGKERVATPISLSLVGWLYLLLGIISLFVGILFYFQGVKMVTPEPLFSLPLTTMLPLIIIGLIPTLNGFLYAEVGLALWRLRPWARIGAIILAVQLSFFLLPLPLTIPLIRFLRKRETRKLFG